MKNIITLLFVLIPCLLIGQKLTVVNDFEGPQTFYSGPSAMWERGAPTMSRINTAHSGTNVWATDLDSNYSYTVISGNSYSYLYTPKYALNGVDSINIGFWHYVDLDSSGLIPDPIRTHGVNIQRRLKSNNGWVLIGYMGDPNSNNWYNTHIGGTHVWFYQNSGWIYSSYRLSSSDLGNKNNPLDSIDFRFCLLLDGQQGYVNLDRNGWAIDDFKMNVYGKTYDIGITKITSPSDTLLGLNNNFIKFWIKNFGPDTVYKMDIKYKYSINGVATPAMAAPSGSLYLNPGDSTEVHFFSTTPIQAGPLSFCVSAELWGDTDSTNNKKCISIGLGMENNDVALFNLGQSLPNPSHSNVRIPISSKSAGVVHLQIVNPIGKLIFEIEKHLTNADNYIDVDVSNWASGVYYYSANFNGQRITKKLIVN